jgi:DNA-binding transcriptional ArsR family regulator/YHS domain-containing protein
MYEKIFQLQEEVFKILANQKRLEIIQLLSNTQLSVNEMVEMLGIPQANLSQHLSPMRRAGLLKVNRVGTKVYYQLADQRIADLVLSVRELLINNEQLDEATRGYFNQPANLYPLAKDVVCGMRVSAARSSFQLKHAGHEYFFCASGCKGIFEKNPSKYAIKQSPQKETVNER